MVDLANLQVGIGLNTGGLASDISKAKSMFSSFGSGIPGILGGVGVALAAVGVAAIGVGITSVKMAGSFQESMTQLVTGAGESQKNIDMVSQGILNMAVATGTSTQQLSAGMYMIESSGQHGAQALLTLQAAAEGAKVGNADLGTVADATTTIMTDFSSQNISAAQAVNTLIATVSAGKTHMQDLSQALSTILPTASSVKVGLNDVMGAMATMTGEGVPAANAATYLRQILMTLADPSKAGAAALQSIGLSAQQVSDDMKKSLPDTLQMIMDDLSKKFPQGSIAYQQALTAIVGGNKQMQGVLDLTGTHMSTFIQNVAGVGNAVKKGGDSINGWSAVQGDFNQKMSQASEVVETLFIRVGTALLPTVTKLISAIIPVITNFSNWLTTGGHLQSILSGIGTVIGIVAGVIGGLVSAGLAVVGFFQHCQIAALALMIPLGALGGYFVSLAVSAIASFIAAAPAMIAGFISGAAAAWTMAAGVIAATWPFLAIGAAVGLLIAVIILLVQHWGQVVSFLKDVWQGFTNWLGSSLHAVGQFFVNLWNGIISGLTAAWNMILGLLKGFLTLMLNIWTAPFRAIGALFEWLYQHNTYFADLVNAIISIVKTGLAWLQNAWTTFTGWLGNLWKGLSSLASNAWNAVKNAVMAVVNAVVSWLESAWNKEITGLGIIWSKISGIASKAWDAVVSVFQAVWGRISGILGSLWSNLSGWFGKLASQALSWGENLITGFINGIKNMLGNLGSTLGNVANTVKNFLGFHSPTKEGAGSEADRWAPAFVNMYAAGLIAGIPKIQNAVASLMKPIALNLNPPASSGLGMASVAATNAISQTGANQPAIVTLQLDSKTIAQATLPHVGAGMVYAIRSHSSVGKVA